MVTRDKNDEVIRIDDLQSYVKTLIKLDATSLENIAWKIENPFVELEILPNQYRAIYVPVKVLGEVSGMVYLKENGNAKGQGRIRVHIFDAEGNLVRSILTETDGYFNYLGLAPGNYTAEVDSLQLENLGLKSNTARIPFTIQYEEYGAVVDSVEFTLTNQEE